MANAATRRPAQVHPGGTTTGVGLPAAPPILNRGLMSAVRYRGREGMWAWILHRLTGLGILLFLVMHVVETATVIYYPDVYDSFLAAYRSPLFRLAELVIVFAVLYHAINGLRIIVQDFWPIMMRHQRTFALAAAIIVALAMVPITWIMLAPLAGLRDEPGTARHAERCALQPEAPACQHAPAATPGEVSL